MIQVVVGGGVLVAVLAAGGFFADKTGEAAEDLTNSAIKIALVGGAGYFLLKKYEVI